MTDHEDQAPGIAIVGMSGRFPGAKDVETFWENVKAGKDTVSHFGPDDLDPVVRPLAADTDYVCAKGLLDDIDMFDAAFFGVLPRDAEVMDPQHRVFLEICWEALEGAGYDPSRYDGAIGCYGGCYMDTYVLHNLCADNAFRERLVQSIQVGTLQTELGNDKDYLATRVAFKLGLRGPAMTLQTACSTSLVAIATACQALESYSCDMALAGGVTIVLPQLKGYQYKEGSMLSPDGVCRPFDADGAGTVFSNGAAVVLLKRLEDAIADGDTIHAVIRGYATNNDGNGKVSYTAPSPEGQSEVISLALGMADIDARSISYVEAHGTATPLGDPIEIAGLTNAYRQDTDDNQYCAVGSVKGNLGHLDCASGAIGLIKTALTLRDATLPPLAHFNAPNPKIDFEASPFYVNTELRAWPEQEGPRRAGVSSFGVGGTNAHVVVEEPPVAAAASKAKGTLLLPLSARSNGALEAAVTNLESHLVNTELCIGDVAATLQRGRKAFARRAFAVAETRDEAVTALGRVLPPEAPAGAPRIGFLFTGQGAQYPGMGSALYDSYSVYRETVDRVAETLLTDPGFGRDIREFLIGRDADAEELQQTALAQPALFTVEAAMAALLESFGIRPEVVIGHSVGEIAAGVSAGTFSLEDAARFVARRGRLMGEMPTGAMLGVRAPRDQVLRLLPDGAVIAGVNGPAITVVSGTFEAIAEAEDIFKREEISASALKVSHGFHSPSMADAAADLGAPNSNAHPGRARIFSTATGDEVSADRFADADYWSDQMLGPVLFAPAVEAAIAAGIDTFVEVGPGSTLTALTMQIAEDEATAAFGTLDGPKDPADARRTMLTGLGQLWVRGTEIDWEALQPGPFRRVPLPTYPFEKKRFWIEADTSPEAATASPASNDDHAGDGVGPAAPAAQGIEDLIRQQLNIVEAQLAAIRRGK